MKSSTLIILILTIFNLRCTSDKTDNGLNDSEGAYLVNGDYDEITVDKLKLEKVIMNNTSFFETYTENINNENKDQSHEKFKPELYKVIGYKKCNNFEHWWIYKNRNVKNFDLEPYKGIFFIITDKEGHGTSNIKLAEDSFTMMITSDRDSTISDISADNLVTTKSFMNYCSDVIDEKGRMTCWDKVIVTKTRILCDKTVQLKSDTTITETVD